MQIISVSLKNIKSHRDKDLHFVNGINVLSGANGAGKSTIFEAIGYALFGVDARDFVGNIERFISIGAKKGEISVVFSTDAGNRYRVSRGVGAGSKWLLATEVGGAFEVEDHAGAQETEGRIKHLLGLDSSRSLADQFKLVIGPFQNDFLGPFVLKQSTKRQEAFDEILGIDAWRKTYKGTSSLVATTKNKIEILNVEIAGKQEQAACLPDKDKELLEIVKDSGSHQKTLSEKEDALKKIDKKLLQLDGQEKTINTIRAEIQVLENRIRDGEGKIADQKKRVIESEQAQAMLERTKIGKEAFEAAEKELKNLRTQEQQRRAIEKEINELEKKRAKLAQTLEHEQHEVVNAEKQLTEEERQLHVTRKGLTADKNTSGSAARLPKLREDIEKMRAVLGLLNGKQAGLQEGKEKLSEGVCPFFKESCKNIIGKKPRDVFTERLEDLEKEKNEFNHQIEVLNREIEKAEKAQQELNSLKVRGEEIEKQIKTLEKKRQDNDKRKSCISGLKEKQTEADKAADARKKDLNVFQDLDNKIKTMEEAKAKHQTERDAFFANQKDAQDLKNRQEALKKMVVLLEELTRTLTEKRKEIVQLQKVYDAKKHAEERAQKEKLVAENATLRQQIKNLGKEQKRIEGEIKKLKEIKKEIKVKLDERKKIEKKESLIKFLRNQIFKNVSTQLSDRFREEISLRADRIYRNIAETDEELYWGDKYQIVLRDMVDGQIRERTDDQLSGGQIMSSVVALRLALLQTIGARVAFFDEPTSNLDATRRENLAHAFRAIDVGREELTEHWYDQLFLISHDVAFTEVTDQIISLDAD